MKDQCVQLTLFRLQIVVILTRSQVNKVKKLSTSTKLN